MFWCKAKMLGCDVILNAVWKSTRNNKALARESLLPWYMRGNYAEKWGDMCICTTILSTHKIWHFFFSYQWHHSPASLLSVRAGKPWLLLLWLINPFPILAQICKQQWPIFILEAWNYSCSTGIQPGSHRESIIVLLPKEGKDIKNLNNWRPITLSNCDAKILTKAFALRMSHVLNEIKVNTQTAYIRGRSVIDNYN